MCCGNKRRAAFAAYAAMGEGQDNHNRRRCGRRRNGAPSGGPPGAFHHEPPRLIQALSGRAIQRYQARVAARNEMAAPPGSRGAHQYWPEEKHQHAVDQTPKFREASAEPGADMYRARDFAEVGGSKEVGPEPELLPRYSQVMRE